MDAANLTFAHIFLTILGSFLVGGVGLAIGWRVLPITKTYRKPEKFQLDEKVAEKSVDTTKAHGRLFPTEVLGLEGNVVRYREGSFAKAYGFEPAHTLYDDEVKTEQRVEELKTLLKFEKPDKTIIQFRFINKPDDGTTLRNHLQTRNTEKSDSLASLLQATNLALFEEAIRSAEASVTGRKEGLVTILFSQAYEHFTGTIERPNITGIDLVKNSGVKIIGKQIGGFERLADDCELSKETIAAVRAINNQYGRYTQWVMVIGSGGDKIIEMAGFTPPQRCSGQIRTIPTKPTPVVWSNLCARICRWQSSLATLLKNIRLD